MAFFLLVVIHHSIGCTHHKQPPMKLTFLRPGNQRLWCMQPPKTAHPACCNGWNVVALAEIALQRTRLMVAAGRYDPGSQVDWNFLLRR